MNEFATYHAIVIVFRGKQAEILCLRHFKIILVEVYKITESLGSLPTLVSVYSKTLIRPSLCQMKIDHNSEVTLSSRNSDKY